MARGDTDRWLAGTARDAMAKAAATVSSKISTLAKNNIERNVSVIQSLSETISNLADAAVAFDDIARAKGSDVEEDDGPLDE